MRFAMCNKKASSPSSPDFGWKWLKPHRVHSFSSEDWVAVDAFRCRSQISWWDFSLSSVKLQSQIASMRGREAWNQGRRSFCLQSVQLSLFACCAPYYNLHFIQPYNYLISTSPLLPQATQLVVVYSKTSAALPLQHKSLAPHTHPPTCSTYTLPSSTFESPCMHKNCSTVNQSTDHDTLLGNQWWRRVRGSFWILGMVR